MNAALAKLPKSLAKIHSDPRVAEAWSEQANEDGYWILLKPGFADLDYDRFQPRHCIHEWTVRDVLLSMSGVRRCECSDCKPSEKGKE